MADSEPETSLPEQIFMALSKSATSGVPAARTIRLMGFLQDIPVQILIDFGSSSSFINQALVPQLQQCQISALPTSIQGAGGGILCSDSILQNVT